MRKFSKFSLLLAAALLVLTALQPLAAAAKPEPVVPVEIRAKAYDAVGQALADQTLEAFKKDKRFQIAASDEPKLVIHLSTMGAESRDGQRISAYAVIVAFDLPGNNYQTLVGNTVGILNQKEVPDDAKAIVYNTAKLIENYPALVDAVKRNPK
ncbi:MAG: hypothetical protein N2491_04425 [Negativicutes bacterium]|nr:hypothetical protein [Negativicutes bacterium]